jgi:lysophospholipase L1-like esterase
MDNFRSKVLTFIIFTILLLFTASYFNKIIVDFYPNFKGINIISEIIERPVKKNKKPILKKINTASTNTHIYNTFEKYDAFENDIIGFDQYNDQVALSDFQNKILELTKQKKVKIRIAWFGDSTIEGDLITEQLRVLFNNYFKSNTGVGFLPINTVSSKSRSTGTIDFSGDFETYNFIENPKNLFISGYSYDAPNLDLTITNKVKKKPSANLEKWLYCGKGDSLHIEMDEKIRVFNPTKEFNKILLDDSPSNVIHFKIKNNTAPIFGVSMEPETGIIIDNYSFRGITGVELRKVQNQVLDEINTSSTYDLVVFQYGVNLLFRPELDNFDNYYSKMNHVIQKLKKHLTKSEFLIISSADRAFKYNGEWKTAIGIDSLIKVQAKLAYKNKIPFFNLYKSMGGEGTIVKWADTVPRLANKDYIHFNYKGANKVANIIFNSFINDYNKILKSKSSKIKK